MYTGRRHLGRFVNHFFRDSAHRGTRLELFADVFNLLDNPDAIRNLDLLAGAGRNAPVPRKR